MKVEKQAWFQIGLGNSLAQGLTNIFGKGSGSN